MTKLDELLKDARALEVQAEQDRQAAIAGQCEAARYAIVAAFGGLWDELAPYADAGNVWTSNGRVTTWWTVIRAPGLAPFSAAVQNVNHMGNAAPFLVPHTSPESGWTRSAFGDLPEFLLARKRAGEVQSAEALTKRISDLRAKLDGRYDQLAKTLLDADAALAELSALDMAGVQTWTKLHVNWQMWRNRLDEEKREEQEREARQAAATAEYEAAFSTFWREYRRAFEINKGRLDALQAELDQPFTAHELTFAYCAEDEEGNRFAGTAAAWSLSDGPDAAGYWTVVEGGDLVRRHYYHLVSLSAPVEMRPSERKVYASVYLDAPPEPGWFTLYFHPGADRGEIACQAAALLEPWPAWPLAPADLDRYEVEKIQHKITGENDSIPF